MFGWVFLIVPHSTGGSPVHLIRFQFHPPLANPRLLIIPVPYLPLQSMTKSSFLFPSLDLSTSCPLYSISGWSYWILLRLAWITLQIHSAKTPASAFYPRQRIGS